MTDTTWISGWLEDGEDLNPFDFLDGDFVRMKADLVYAMYCHADEFDEDPAIAAQIVALIKDLESAPVGAEWTGNVPGTTYFLTMVSK